jgi:hypothetical protein
MLTNADVMYRFRVYLMWRWGSGARSVIYTLATAAWQVRFLAGTFVVGQGVTSLAGSGVTGDVSFTRDHRNPVVQGPTGNIAVVVRP